MGSLLTKESHIVDTLVGDDVLLHILEFVKEDLKVLKSIGLTNKYFTNLIFKDPRTDMFFGERHRQYWKNIFHLNELVVRCYSLQQRDHVQVDRKASNRLGILSAEEERSTILFDHLQVFSRKTTTTTTPSTGYFGFVQLRTEEVAVWGDFSGLTCLKNMDSFLHPTRIEEETDTYFDESFQVMTVCAHGDFLFLGCASGEVHCISNTSTSEESSDRGYPYLSKNHEHMEEITDIAAVGKKHLATSSIASANQVILHWGALEDGDLGRTSTVNVNAESVFSLAAPTTEFGTNVLQIGAPNSTIISVCDIWDDPGLEVQCLKYNTVGTRNGKVVFLKYLGHDEKRQDLIVGTASGELLIYGHDDRIETTAPEDITELENLKHYEPYFFARGCGCLEAAELVGDVLILAGGPAGCIHFLSWKTYQVFGNRVVHPGVGRCVRSYGGRLHSTVVGLHVAHERGSLITLCRDGHVHEISFKEEVERERNNARRRLLEGKKRRFRKRAQGQNSQTPVARRARVRRKRVYR